MDIYSGIGVVKGWNHMTTRWTSMVLICGLLCLTADIPCFADNRAKILRMAEKLASGLPEQEQWAMRPRLEEWLAEAQSQQERENIQILLMGIYNNLSDDLDDIWLRIELAHDCSMEREKIGETDVDTKLAAELQDAAQEVLADRERAKQIGQQLIASTTSSWRKAYAYIGMNAIHAAEGGQQEVRIQDCEQALANLAALSSTDKEDAFFLRLLHGREEEILDFICFTLIELYVDTGKMAQAENLCGRISNKKLVEQVWQYICHIQDGNEEGGH